MPLRSLPLRSPLRSPLLASQAGRRGSGVVSPRACSAALSDHFRAVYSPRMMLLLTAKTSAGRSGGHPPPGQCRMLRTADTETLASRWPTILWAGSDCRQRSTVHGRLSEPAMQSWVGPDSALENGRSSHRRTRAIVCSGHGTAWLSELYSVVEPSDRA